jgi:alpha-1,3-rhamnosyl/mannosyltransferase
VCGYWKITPRRSEVLHSGIPAAWIEQAERSLPDWSSRPLEIVTVSTVNRYKRQELVVRALPALIAKPGLEGLQYRIVGRCRPEQAQRLRAVARELGVEDRIHLEGLVTQERVGEFLRSARCFVLMSLAESFGLPAIEAMSLGTPVVTSDCCCMPEVCGDAAELVAVDDLDQLVDRIASVLTDPGRAERLRAAGRDNVRRFDWNVAAEGMAGCLAEIAAAGARDRARPTTA